LLTDFFGLVNFARKYKQEITHNFIYNRKQQKREIPRRRRRRLLSFALTGLILYGSL
jgi:hypothetical protein